MNDKPRVLVTGASGFIAHHCIAQLLREGYSVRGTLRTPARETEVRETLARQVDADDRLSFAMAELDANAGWEDAVDGCTFVLHVASPFPAGIPKNEDELIVPARDGTIRVLRVAAKAGVKRVVMTSTLGAVAYGHESLEGRKLDENDWSNLQGAGVGPYEKSKTLAERAAWDFVKGAEANGLELAVINPGLVLGPILNARTGTSALLVRRLMTRQLPACPRIGFNVVDVRDVAAAHLAALIVPDAAGRRFCCSNGFAWIADIADILHDHFADRGYRIPTRRMPDRMFRLAALFDPTLRLIVQLLGKKNEVSSARIRETLGWQPRSMEEMTVSMADSLIEFGIVKPK